MNVGGHHFHIKGRPMQKDLVVIGLPKPSWSIYETCQTISSTCVVDSKDEPTKQFWRPGNPIFMGQVLNRFKVFLICSEPIWMTGGYPLLWIQVMKLIKLSDNWQTIIFWLVMICIEFQLSAFYWEAWIWDVDVYLNLATIIHVVVK